MGGGEWGKCGGRNVWAGKCGSVGGKYMGGVCGRNVGGSVWEEFVAGSVWGQCGREILSPCQLLEGFVTQVQLGSLFLSAPCPDP